MQKIILLICLFILLPLGLSAQGSSFKRYDCLAGGQAPSAALMGAPRRLRLVTDWDSTRVYPVAVVLVSFSDLDFSSEDAADRYNRIFNEVGYNEGKGPGCVADYFLEQSEGWFHPRFDIHGPVKVGATCKGNNEHGDDVFREAVRIAGDSLKVDFSPYDWDGNGFAEHVIFIYAGYGGNETANVANGCIWPNTSSFATVIVGNVKVAYYSGSAEMWSNNKLCGIGTVCHEYSHALGLPDLYPTNDGDEYSVVDEWDLMDGGNFVAAGWCPPNYSIHEKMLLGWAEPEELTAPVAISEMAPVNLGGKAYMVRTEDNAEFFLLENRQWNGWDLLTPGHGLVITRVHYDKAVWNANTVNVRPNHHRYELIHADNMDYDDWDAAIGDGSHRVNGHSRILSGSPYPFTSDEGLVNDSLTDTSVPAAVTFSGKGLLSKPITNIAETDGLISFSFMGGVPSGIADGVTSDSMPKGSYDLLGRKTAPDHRGIIIRSGKKFIHQLNKHNYEINY